jgi:hypothetical protein
MKISIFINIIVFLLIFAGCNDKMETQSQVTKFRILAVEASSPEVLPGGLLGFRAQFAMASQANVAWALINPTLWSAIKNGEKPDSLPSPPVYLSYTTIDKDGISVFGSDFEKDPFVAVSDDIFSNNDDPSLSLSIPVFILGCNNGAIDKEIFTSLILKLTNMDVSALNEACVQTDPKIEPETITAYKYVRISNFKDTDATVPALDTEVNPNELNKNPVISTLKIDGTVHYPSLPADKTGVIHCKGSDGCRDSVTFEVALTPSSFQFYYQEDPLSDNMILTNEMENIYLSWFCDGGEFSADQVRSSDAQKALDAKEKKYKDTDFKIMADSHWFDVDWKPPFKGGSFNLWIVAHDLRGGTGWQHYNIKAITEIKNSKTAAAE